MDNASQNQFCSGIYTELICCSSIFLVLSISPNFKLSFCMGKWFVAFLTDKIICPTLISALFISWVPKNIVIALGEVRNAPIYLTVVLTLKPSNTKHKCLLRKFLINMISLQRFLISCDLGIVGRDSVEYIFFPNLTPNYLIINIHYI